MLRWPFVLAGLTAIALVGVWLQAHSRSTSTPTTLSARSTFTTLSARVWRPSSPGFVHPELDKENGALAAYLAKRDDFGIALAGGGTRGLFLSHGAVRVLREAGITQRARYLTTSSGSVWLALPMYYQKQDTLDEFLGTSLPPSELSPEALTGSVAGTAVSRMNRLMYPRYPKAFKPNGTSSSGAFENEEGLVAAAEAAFRHTLKERLSIPEQSLEALLACTRGQDPVSCFLDHVIPDSSLQDWWPIISGFFFMEPFGLATPNSLQCHESEYERVLEQLKGGTTLHAARDMSQDLPFAIQQTAVLAPLTGRPGAPLATFPVEHTPLYTGTPVSYVGPRAWPYDGIGDVLVSSYAWPGEALDNISGAPESKTRVQLRPYTINLGQLSTLAGIATSYIADFQVRTWAPKLPKWVVTLAEKILPHTLIWSPLDAGPGGVPRTRNLAMGDAGIYDDVGHIPLLRRKVKKLLIYDSSAVHDNSTGRDAENLCEMVYFFAAFGQPGCLDPRSPAGASSPEMPEGRMTVFEASEFEPFWATVRESHARGEPAVHRGRFTVVDNDFLGIEGGWKVDIVFVVLLPSKQWVSQLPQETKPLLKPYFPNYLANEMKSLTEFSAMSQYSSWLTRERVIKEVQELLGEGPPEDAIVV